MSDTDDPGYLPERRLSPAEVRAYLDAPLTEMERENVRALIAWFRRRYPMPLDRLAYVRRAYARWQRTRGLAARVRTGSADAAGFR